MPIKKTLLLSSVLLSALSVSWVFAADSGTATTPSTSTSTSNTSVPSIGLEYKLQNNKATIILKKNFTYSIDKYLYFNLKDGAFDKIKDLKVDLPWSTDKTSVVYACSADENILEISFAKYKQKVLALTDSKKKAECETKFIYAITTAGTTSNTFKFNPWDPLVSLELTDNTFTDIPFDKIETRNSDNNLVNSFSLVKAVNKKAKTPTAKPVVKPKKEEKKVINTKKTWLASNILLALMFVILFSAFNIKKRVSE